MKKSQLIYSVICILGLLLGACAENARETTAETENLSTPVPAPGDGMIEAPLVVDISLAEFGEFSTSYSVELEYYEPAAADEIQTAFQNSLVFYTGLIDDYLKSFHLVIPFGDDLLAKGNEYSIAEFRSKKEVNGETKKYRIYLYLTLRDDSYIYITEGKISLTKLEKSEHKGYGTILLELADLKDLSGMFFIKEGKIEGHYYIECFAKATNAYNSEDDKTSRYRDLTYESPFCSTIPQM